MERPDPNVKTKILRTKRGEEHGMCDSPEYRSWVAMKKRCYNPKYEYFEGYGGKGIRVCDRWLDSFANFLSDMGVRPEGHTLDRIDVSGNYTPENCRWATIRQQNRNKTTTIRLPNGELMIDVAKRNGISPTVAYNRVTRYGYSPEQAVTTIKKKTSSYRGVSFDKSRNRWNMSIFLQGKKFAKRFKTEEEAITAIEGLKETYGITA